MKAFISNRILLQDIPAPLGRLLAGQLTLLNPKWADNQKMGRWQGKTLKFLKCYNWTDQGLCIPRGFSSQLQDMAKQQGLHLIWEDGTREMKPVGFEFKGKLRDYQAQAATAVMRRRFGLLQAPTGSGKTVMALFIIAERQQPALIVVHTKELMNQWVDRVHSFLGIPVDEIGIIGGGKMKVGERITVAMIQSLYKCAHEVSQHVGFLICDEVHRAPSRTFTEAASAFDSKFTLGLSATPYRRDGLTKLINFYFGDQVAAVDQKALTESGAILPFVVKWVKTEFKTDLDASSQYSAMLSELTQDAVRNRLVCSEASRQAKTGEGIPLIISDRKAHCQVIAETLDSIHGISATVLTGDLPGKQREAVVARLNAGKCQALVATGALIGEGFDLPALGAVILATPIKFKGRVIQSIGRVLRPSPGQDMAVVVDFEDVHVGVLKASARARAQVYRSRDAL